jgi:hypothetical protein
MVFKMSIKNDELYPIYLNYLENRNHTKGGFELAKISKSVFEDFVFRYENQPLFKEKQDNSYRQISREEKIEEIVNDDFELFLEEMGSSSKTPHHDEDLFDF